MYVNYTAVKMNQFLQKHKLVHFPQYETGSLSSSITIKEIQFIISVLFPNGFYAELFQIFK